MLLLCSLKGERGLGGALLGVVDADHRGHDRLVAGGDRGLGVGGAHLDLADGLCVPQPGELAAIAPGDEGADRHPDQRQDEADDPRPPRAAGAPVLVAGEPVGDLAEEVAHALGLLSGARISAVIAESAATIIARFGVVPLDAGSASSARPARAPAIQTARLPSLNHFT